VREREREREREKNVLTCFFYPNRISVPLDFLCEFLNSPEAERFFYAGRLLLDEEFRQLVESVPPETPEVQLRPRPSFNLPSGRDSSYWIPQAEQQEIEDRHFAAKRAKKISLGEGEAAFLGVEPIEEDIPASQAE
jgi:hypothetical protein